MRARIKQWTRNTLLIALLLSVLFHLSAWQGLRLSPPPSFLHKKDKVEITILDQSQINTPRLQVVEQPEKALNDEKPDDAKYMSAHDQRVVHETKAQNSGEFRNTAGTGERRPPTESAKVKPLAQQEAKIKTKAKGKTPTDKDGTLPTMSELSPHFEAYEHREEAVSNGSGQAASQTNDFLKDTPPSLETVLNTREFKFYSYYQRIRGQIRQYWEPSIREKIKTIFASGRSIASEHDHITRLIIVLDRNGELLKVQVVGESGTKDLDDAAVEAFRAAAPFPNPPKGIVDQDGTIKISWDFILEADNDIPAVLEESYAQR